MAEVILQFLPLVFVNVTICVCFYGVAKRKSKSPWKWVIGILIVPVFNWLIIVPLLVSKTDLEVLERLDDLEGKPRF